MPDKPAWFRNFESTLREIAALPQERHVTSFELEAVLHVTTRRAQQILQIIEPDKSARRKGVSRAKVLEHLRQESGTDKAKEAQADFEHLTQVLRKLREDRKANPPVLVEAPVMVQTSRLDQLEGVRLEPGRIVVEGFSDPQEARRKLLELAFAIANDQAEFDERVAAKAGGRSEPCRQRSSESTGGFSTKPKPTSRQN